MMNRTSLTAILAVTLAASWTSFAAVDYHLEMEPPDAYFDSDDYYYEGGRRFWREGANGYGSNSFAQGGRHPWTPTCIEVYMPPDNRTDTKNRREWAFGDWRCNREHWAGFSV